ncbi:benzyl alcohol O-benzoyltransferase [Brachypodium distachyon]|uniref:Uncharacterized protein n=1 Tax=Brachypodium distachyon TaxID=15368 RepID=I1HM35_BRADI|nr:benzyl alcohol O-benzoyltransferase [Brachypodium distachyon]PNT71873.1 hypothetical protein BRADI_2g36670v3 [Brachypodium distachyon]|eukprot:XP_010231737.1 benzyl alcohol O-benzoyltransferase [Brachypodium distachyon]
MGSLDVAKESLHSTAPKQQLTFAVRRRVAELVCPAVATPRETKRLSDIDDQDTLRGHVRFALFYRGGSQKQDDDPVGVIRRALAEALVPYYPLAGRLREVVARKLVVDCAGQGVLFVEADADVRLAEIQAAGPLTPPFPCMDQLLFDAQGSDGILNAPLLLIQVTRLLCGGFVFALRLNHTVCDAIGIVQFMGAVAELARGLPSPTVNPAWSRELLEARSPPSPSFPHREYDLLPPPPPPPPSDMVLRTFSFSSGNIATIKKRLGDDKSTTFEALAAALWLARTAALEIPAGELARLVVIANFRPIAAGPDPGLGLPAGYYGNACVPPTALADAGELTTSSSAMSLREAAALVRGAKAAVTADYVRSTADVLAERGRPCLALDNLLVVSDLRHAGFRGVDFGWAGPVYGGPADTVFGVCFFVAVKGEDGEEAVAVPVVLPRIAMDRLAKEVERLCQA